MLLWTAHFERSVINTHPPCLFRALLQLGTDMFKGYIVGSKTKGRISKRLFQENKARQILRKTNISYHLIRTRTCTYQEVKNVRFSEILACFVFLKHPFWDSHFCLITDDISVIQYQFAVLIFNNYR